MTLDRPEFRRKYATLAPALETDFADSSAHEDEETARNIASGYPEEARAQYIAKLIQDAEALLRDSRVQWEAFARAANRQIYSEETARAWLERIGAVWRDELSRLRSGPPA